MSHGFIRVLKDDHQELEKYKRDFGNLQISLLNWSFELRKAPVCSRELWTYPICSDALFSLFFSKTEHRTKGPFPVGTYTFCLIMIENLSKRNFCPILNLSFSDGFLNKLGFQQLWRLRTKAKCSVFHMHRPSGAINRRGRFTLLTHPTLEAPEIFRFTIVDGFVSPSAH